MKSPGTDQKSARASASSVDSVGWDASDSPWSYPLKFPLLTVCSRLRVVSRKSYSLPDNFAATWAIENMKISLLCGVITSFPLILRGWISDASMFSKSSKSAIRISAFQNLSEINSYPRKIPGKTFLPSWWSLDEFSRWHRMILNRCSKRNYWPFEWFSESSFVRCLPICHEVLDILQIATAFHRISPPFFIQSWVCWYCWRTFFHSSYGSFSNAICLGSMRCWSSMIPG